MNDNRRHEERRTTDDGVRHKRAVYQSIKLPDTSYHKHRLLSLRTTRSLQSVYRGSVNPLLVPRASAEFFQIANVMDVVVSPPALCKLDRV
jgi:hypothetical protein